MFANLKSQQIRSFKFIRILKSKLIDHFERWRQSWKRLNRQRHTFCVTNLLHKNNFEYRSHILPLDFLNWSDIYLKQEML